MTDSHTKLYTIVNPRIMQIDRAICMDLSDVNLPISKQTNYTPVHMTLLFTRSLNYPMDIIDRIQAMASERSMYTFTLSRYGRHSDRINGDLADFHKRVNECFREYASDRPPHVELR